MQFVLVITKIELYLILEIYNFNFDSYDSLVVNQWNNLDLYMKSIHDEFKCRTQFYV